MISFEKSKYNIDEHGGVTQPVLILSNPISKDATVKVISTNNGKSL